MTSVAVRHTPLYFLFFSHLSRPCIFFFFFAVYLRSTGNIPPTTTEDAQGVYRSPRVRPQAPLNRADEEWNTYRRDYVPGV